MKRYLFDSNALSALIFDLGQVSIRAKAERSRGAVLGTAMPIAAEILGGVLYSDSRDKNLPLVERKLKAIRIWPFDIAAARTYGELYSELRKRGIQMQVIDLMTAAVALTIPNCTLISSDSDFRRIPGLNVEDWSS